MDGPPPVNFGAELKDAFKPVNAWIANGIAWLDDIQSFYRERATIEKEYAAKINALSKKYYDKKAKKSSQLSVGDTPQLTPGSLESASLTTWTTILTTTEALAKEHDDLSNALALQVCDVLKSLNTRYEDYRKRHESLAAKLQSERDGVYSDLKKSKASYDTECREVEEKRQKVDKSYDASKAKAEKSYRLEMAEMNNIKNSYILQINVTNKHKETYYHQDLPEIINSLQDLNETRVTKLNSLWTTSTNLETTCYQNSLQFLTTQISEISRNVPALDSGMFAKHNVGGWQEPGDFMFEPSPIWHDNSEMVVDATAQVFLRNQLGKSRKGISGIKSDVERRRRETDNLRSKWDSVKLDESQAQTETDVARAMLFSHEEMLPVAAKLLTYQVETDTILGKVGDIERGTQSHNFKHTSPKIPVNCELCGERIWGLTAKAAACKDCGYTCHAKCEMKVPATCPGVLDKAAKKALKEEKRASMAVGNGSETDVSSPGQLSRSNTMNSLSSSYVTASGGSLAPTRMGSTLSKSPTPSEAPSSASAAAPARRIIAPPPDRYLASQTEDAPPEPPRPSTGGHERGKMLYAFTGDGPNELTIDADEAVTIIDDDGAWMTVRGPDGEEGIVPTSYVEKAPSGGPPPLTARPGASARPVSVSSTDTATPKVKKQGPPVAPKGRKKSVKKVRALYDYDAAGDEEISFKAGETFVLVERVEGDWDTVERPGRHGKTGIVPDTYVQLVD